MAKQAVEARDVHPEIAKTELGLAIMLTDEAAVALRVAEGDVLRAEADGTGGVRLFGRDPRVAQDVAIGEDVMDDNRGTLRVLAK